MTDAEVTGSSLHVMPRPATTSAWSSKATDIVANLALGFHIWHGFYSAFQTLGANHPRYNNLRRDLAIAIAAAITIGNLSFPISVQLGIVTL